VVLNRINVFIVAYEPPYPGKGYFPAIGEIALTLGLVCTIVFLYRVFVFSFPILAGSEDRQTSLSPALARPESLPPVWAWSFRGAAVALILGFAVLYAVVHSEAVSGEIHATRWGQAIAPALEEEDRLTHSEHGARPEGYKRVYSLSNAVLNVTTDYYEPARFTHISHDEHVDGDCGTCHHRFSLDEEDRIGFDLEEFHLEFDVHLGGPCSACHEMKMLTVQRCDSCHWFPNEPDDRSRLGLKGAYHQLCIGCHEGLSGRVRAPTDCKGCHHPLTPDHTDLIALTPEVQAREVTQDCLRCHLSVGRAILKTAHWNWGGHSPEICGHEHSGDLGLETLVNNYMIGTGPNREYCGTCHIGLGCVVDQTMFQGPSSVDCLVCHDTTGAYEKEIGAGGAPDPGVDLVRVAQGVGRPSRGTCGACHFYSDGGRNIKHGDLEPILADPPEDFDVHMGRYDMRCQDCHTTREHRIAGMSLSAPAVEGRVLCEDCHGSTPHGISGPLSLHLDNHLRSVSCEACHIPSIAKDSATRVFVDYSKAEEYGPARLGDVGWPEYPPESGVETWERDLIPVYAWYDGTREAYVLGDEVDPTETVVLNQPLGERRDPDARICVFKVHRAVQPYDPDRRVLVLPELWDGFWRHFDLGRAIEEGMRKTGIEYSGRYGYLETAMYTGIHHEVVPASAALGCTDCHDAGAVDCGRCHEGAENREDVSSVVTSRYPNVSNRFDFQALGYDNDPARVGGRFTVRMGSGPRLD
jgi:octaheme c-type cytochrome (tetrathionate reductase family)